MINAGVTSPYTLYDEQTASFGVDKDYDQSDATGFINLFGLSIKERAKLSKTGPRSRNNLLTIPFGVFLHFHAEGSNYRHHCWRHRRGSFFPLRRLCRFYRGVSFMAEQLWKGRFSKAVDSRVNDFNSSIRFDQRMIAQDMRGSGVHAAMLAKQGIISEKDCEDILSGLASIADDLASGALTIDPNAEDVHTFVEQTLTARIGDAGKRLHTGRSRNDQVALDIRLTLRDYSHTLQAYIVELVKVICKKAAENTTAVMPGYTHLQRAQPITFGHALMAYAWMLLRDLQRFEDATARMDAQCPLGSGALAGTTYPLDRQFTAEKLGFAAPCPNSLDGVSDRDFCIELANAISICMMHLSRLSEEIILWCSWEFKFIELDDAFTTGSSIMPQKKNPDVTELIRGKTGRVYGDLNTLLVMMKGIPLAYNKDMQEDKEAIFDAVDTLELCLKTVTPMLDTMKTLPANMRRAAAKGFINATDCADYLTKKGMPFRDAYKLTGCMVSDCISKDKTLEELTLDEFKGYSALFENDIYDAIDLIKCCEGRTSYGGPSEASVKSRSSWQAPSSAHGRRQTHERKSLYRRFFRHHRSAHCRPSGRPA